MNHRVVQRPRRRRQQRTLKMVQSVLIYSKLPDLNNTVTFRFGLCDYRQQLPKSIPGNDGWESGPVWGSKGRLADHAKQGPGASQAWFRWTPYAHHGTSGNLLVFPSSHLSGATVIACTDGASSSPAPP